MSNIVVHRDIKDWVKTTMTVPFGFEKPITQKKSSQVITTHAEVHDFPVQDVIPAFWREALDPETLEIPNPAFLFQTLLQNEDQLSEFPSKQVLYQTFFPVETRFNTKAPRFDNIASSIDKKTLLQLLDMVQTLNEPFQCESNPALAKLCETLAKKGDLTTEDEKTLIATLKGDYLELSALKTLAQLSTHLSVLGKTSAVQKLNHLFSQLYTNHLGVVTGRIQDYHSRNKLINFGVVSASTLSMISGLGSPIIGLINFISNTLHIPSELLFGNPFLFLAIVFATSIAVIYPLQLGLKLLNKKITDALDKVFHNKLTESDKANFVKGLEHYWNEIHLHKMKVLQNESDPAISLESFVRLSAEPNISSSDKAALDRCIELLSQKGSRSALKILEKMTSPYLFVLMRLADNTFGDQTIPNIADTSTLRSKMLEKANTRDERKSAENFIKKIESLQKDGNEHSMTEIFRELGNLPKPCFEILLSIEGFKQFLETEISIPTDFNIHDAMTKQQKELLKNERYLESPIKKIESKQITTLLSDPEFQADKQQIEKLAEKIEQLQNDNPSATFRDIADDLKQFSADELGKIFNLKGFEIFKIVGRILPPQDMLDFQDAVLNAVNNTRTPEKLLQHIRSMSQAVQEKVELFLPQLHLYEPYLFSKKINIQTLQEQLSNMNNSSEEYKQLSKIIEILSSLPNPENKAEFSGHELYQYWDEEQVGNYFACLAFLYGLHPALGKNLLDSHLESKREITLLERILLFSGAFGTGIGATAVINKLFLHAPTQLLQLQPFGLVAESAPFYLTLGLFFYQAGNIAEKIAEISSVVRNSHYQKGFSSGVSKIFGEEPNQNFFHRLKNKLFGQNYNNQHLSDFSSIRRTSFGNSSLDAKQMWSDWLEGFEHMTKPSKFSETA